MPRKLSSVFEPSREDEDEDRQRDVRTTGVASLLDCFLSQQNRMVSLGNKEGDHQQLGASPDQQDVERPAPNDSSAPWLARKSWD